MGPPDGFPPVTPLRSKSSGGATEGRRVGKEQSGMGVCADPSRRSSMCSMVQSLACQALLLLLTALRPCHLTLRPWESRGAGGGIRKNTTVNSLLDSGSLFFRSLQETE